MKELIVQTARSNRCYPVRSNVHIHVWVLIAEVLNLVCIHKIALEEKCKQSVASVCSEEIQLVTKTGLFTEVVLVRPDC